MGIQDSYLAWSRANPLNGKPVVAAEGQVCFDDCIFDKDEVSHSAQRQSFQRRQLGPRTDARKRKNIVWGSGGNTPVAGFVAPWSWEAT